MSKQGGKIFINYRRDDSPGESGRLYDRLASRFPGKVFRDVVSLEPGVSWQEAIDQVLSETKACIVVIGRKWLDIRNPEGKRRLEDSSDLVRREIVAALLQKGTLIFPVLVGGARMPNEKDLPDELRHLCDRNALEITEQGWDAGYDRLVAELSKIKGFSKSDDSKPKQKALWIPLTIILLVILAWVFLRPSPHGSFKPSVPSRPTGLR